MDKIEKALEEYFDNMKKFEDEIENFWKNKISKMDVKFSKTNIENKEFIGLYISNIDKNIIKELVNMDISSEETIFTVIPDSNSLYAVIKINNK